MDQDELRSAIVVALEMGAPVSADGKPLEGYEDLFAAGAAGPLLGLSFDERSFDIVALPLAQAFSSPFFVPFDFDEPWSGGAEGAKALAKGMMARMGQMLRERRLPTLDDALAKAE